MIAVDTNVLVRFLARDDARQAARAEELLRANEVWISKTVLLETEWVLRSLYRIPPQTLAEALGALLGLGSVVVEDELAVAKALEWFGKGLDFADAMHLASAGNARRFATFDRKFARQARDVTKVETLLL